jgi:hypothetical protein
MIEKTEISLRTRWLGRRVLTRCCPKVIVLFLFWIGSQSGSVHAQSSYWEPYLGKRAPVHVSTPAFGPWAKKHPFDPDKFGQLRGSSPSTSSKSSVIVLYTTTLSKEMMLAVRKIDAILEKEHETINGSEPSIDAYIHFLDSKGAQLGGYTAEELSDRIARIQEIAAENDLSHVSIGIAANASPERVGLNSEVDGVLVFVSPETGKGKTGNVVWYTTLKSNALDDSSIEEWSKQLQEAIQRSTKTP